MTAEERRVLPLVDGLRPLRDIVAQSKLVEFEVYEAVHHLLELGIVEVSLGAAPPKVTPIAKDEVKAPPARSWSIPVAIFFLLLSIAIGRWATPALNARAERARPATTLSSSIDDSQRLALALEVYHSIRGEYPTELRALSREGYLPPAAVSSFYSRFDYHSDGTTYSKTAR
jgi:hypothetical protein